MNIFVGFGAILRHETNHGSHLPGFALGQCGVAAPTSLNAHHICIHHNALLSGVDLSCELAGSIYAFALVLHHHADAEDTIVGSNESKRVVAMLSAGIAAVIIVGGNSTIGINQIGTAKVQTMRAFGVLHFHFHFLIFLQLYTGLHIGIDIGITGSDGFGNASGHFVFVHLLPRISSQRNGIVCVCQVPVVLFACCASHGVVSRRGFKAGKDAIAHKHCTTRVAHHLGS